MILSSLLLAQFFMTVRNGIKNHLMVENFGQILLKNLKQSFPNLPMIPTYMTQCIIHATIAQVQAVP
jgi:hypothetical protein